MKLELKSIHVFHQRSEETYCYSANLHLNGKKVAHVGNGGHGGCDDVQWLDRNAEAEITAHFAGMSEVSTDLSLGDEPFTLQPDLELWCSEQITLHNHMQDLKRIRRTKIAMLKGDECFTFRQKPVSLDVHDSTGTTTRERIVAKHGSDITIINGLTDDELIAALARHRVFIPSIPA